MSPTPIGGPASGASSAQDPTGLKSRAASARTRRSAVTTMTALPVDAGSAMIRCSSIALGLPNQPSDRIPSCFATRMTRPTSRPARRILDPFGQGRTRFPAGRDRIWARTARLASGMSRDRSDTPANPAPESRPHSPQPIGSAAGATRQPDLAPRTRLVGVLDPEKTSTGL